MNTKINDLNKELKLKTATEINARKNTIANRIILGIYILLVFI